MVFAESASRLGEMRKEAFVNTQIDVLRKALEAGTISQEEFNAAQLALLEKSGMLTEAEKEAQRAADSLIQTYIDGKAAPEDFAQALLKVKGALDQIPDSKKIRIDWELGQIPDIGGAAKETGKGTGGRGMQSGGVMPFSGMALVGEAGPELLQLPGGSRVYNNQQTRQFISQDTINVSNNVGAAVLAERRRRQLDRLARGF